jgi:hypothetical protein
VQVANSGAKEPFLPPNTIPEYHSGAEYPILPPKNCQLGTDEHSRSGQLAQCSSFRYRSLAGNRFRIKVLQASSLFTPTTSFLPFPSSFPSFTSSTSSTSSTTLLSILTYFLPVLSFLHLLHLLSVLPFLPFLLLLPAIRYPAQMALKWLLAGYTHN